MTSDPALSRRVSRLENETESIYELIDEFRAETRSHFASIVSRLDGSDRRFETVDGRLDTLETTVNSTNHRLDTLDTTTTRGFSQIETTLAEILHRLPKSS